MPRRSKFAMLIAKLRKVESNTKQIHLFLLPRRSKFAISNGKVTKSREQNKINPFIFYAETE